MSKKVKNSSHHVSNSVVNKSTNSSSSSSSHSQSVNNNASNSSSSTIRMVIIATLGAFFGVLLATYAPTILSTFTSNKPSTQSNLNPSSEAPIASSTTSSSQIPVREPSVKSNIRGVPRQAWEPSRPFADLLDIGRRPVILTNSIASEFARWSLDDIANLAQGEKINGFYRSSSSPIFGPYYDEARPFHHLHSIYRKGSYEVDISLPKSSLVSTFQSSGPPYYMLTSSLDAINPALESQLNVTEFIKLNPKRSSVNLWLGMKDDVTPCHYDGYRNFYVQLSGQKKFILAKPEYRNIVKVYPFLHPSYGQCMEGNLSHRLNQNEAVYETVLSPGEMLYIPPFWLHEVETLSPSVSLNFWTDIDDSIILDTIFKLPIPLLSGTIPTILNSEIGLNFPADDEAVATSLSHRLVIASVLSFEILQPLIGKQRAASVYTDIANRYASLRFNKVLSSLSPAFADNIMSKVVTWRPRELRGIDHPSIWPEFLNNPESVHQLDEYVKLVIAELVKCEVGSIEFTLASYIEYLGLQAGGDEFASTFMQILEIVSRRVKKISNDASSFPASSIQTPKKLF